MSKTKTEVLSAEWAEDLSSRQRSNHHPLSRVRIADVCKEVATLLDAHADEVEAIVNKSATKARTVSISLNVDCADKTPQFGIKLKISPEPLTDNRTIGAADPDQQQLTGMGEGDPT